MKKLSPQRDKLYQFLKKHDGAVSTGEMIKHMKWNGDGAISHLSHQLRTLEDDGYIKRDYVRYLKITIV